MGQVFEPNLAGAAHVYSTISGISAGMIENRLWAGTPGNWQCIISSTSPLSPLSFSS